MVHLFEGRVNRRKNKDAPRIGHTQFHACGSVTTAEACKRKNAVMEIHGGVFSFVSDDEDAGGAVLSGCKLLSGGIAGRGGYARVDGRRSGGVAFSRWRRCEGFGGRSEDESFADQGESRLWKLGLE